MLSPSIPHDKLRRSILDGVNRFFAPQKAELRMTILNKNCQGSVIYLVHPVILSKYVSELGRHLKSCCHTAILNSK